MSRIYADFIEDILDCIEKLENLTEHTNLEELENDIKLNLAIERLFEIIGEASNRIPKELQAKYPDIPWIDMIGMRNIIIHCYDKVDPSILWKTAKDEIPQVKKYLQKMLDEIDQ